MKNKVSVWMGNFENEKLLKKFIEIKYTNDGDSIPSLFEKEYNLKYYDKDLVEMKFINFKTSNIYELLKDFSYYESFDINNIKINKEYNSVILIYDYENIIEEKIKIDSNKKMEYLGQIDYEKIVDNRW